MRFVRFEDRLEHRQRIERIDRERDADELRMTVAHRRGATLREKGVQRLGRGVLGRLQREDGHGGGLRFRIGNE